MAQEVNGAGIALELQHAGKGLALRLLLGQPRQGKQMIGGLLEGEGHRGVAVGAAGVVGHGGLTGKEGADEVLGLLVGLKGRVLSHRVGCRDGVPLGVSSVQKAVQEGAAAAEGLDGQLAQFIPYGG